MEREFLELKAATNIEKPEKQMDIFAAEKSGNLCFGSIDYRDKDSNGNFIGNTYLWTMSFAARLDRFERQRFEAMAKVAKARIIAVECPSQVLVSNKPKEDFDIKKLKEAGIDPYFSSDIKKDIGLKQEINVINILSDYLSKIKKTGKVMTGDFSPWAREMLSSVNEKIFSKETRDQEINMLLYSQGGLIGSEIASLINDGEFGLDLKIKDIFIFEGVASERFNLNMLRIDEEDSTPGVNKKHDVTNNWLRQNDRYQWTVMPSDRILGEQQFKELYSDQQKRLIPNMAGLFLGTNENPINKIYKNNNRIGLERVFLYYANGSVAGKRSYEKRLLNNIEEKSLKYGKKALETYLISIESFDIDNETFLPRHPSVHSIPFAVELIKDIESRKI